MLYAEMIEAEPPCNGTTYDGVYPVICGETYLAFSVLVKGELGGLRPPDAHGHQTESSHI